MFEAITRRFSDIVGGVLRKKITEGNVRDTLREIRVALLEADVAFEVVKDFLAKVEVEALGERVMKGVNPGQQFISVVYEEMAKLMGPVDPRIHFQSKGPTVILMAGLQGSGKTTTCGKLALLLKTEAKRRPLLVAADVQRPAAIDQLVKLGEQVGVPVFSEAGVPPPQICLHSLDLARRDNRDTVILDTAGRLHIDEQMMAEVRQVAELTKPHEIFLVCDAMTGQD
ncbi:MAG: signal recognition particle receptor subunit alpha, partial [Planctomycetes bacterium]|nr:signal recognition particle receptor subunit alpha [Planctomycetota bacterium]